MGREVRRVPPDWQHPKDDKGNYVPLYSGPWSKRRREWLEGNQQWENGFVSDYEGGWKPKQSYHMEEATSWEDWQGHIPCHLDYMPEWPESECTHWQMYETCTEGTPISPIMASAEELARWLADNKASSFGNMTATYEQWLATIGYGSAPSAVFSPATGLQSGVAAAAQL